jgi:hypothetical protein
MTKSVTIAVCFITIATALVWPARAQDKSAQLIAAVNALKQQEAEIADNQGKLDQKIAEVGETVRVARIFMSRAGGKHKPPPKP